jgi:hypothetical protein
MTIASIMAPLYTGPRRDVHPDLIRTMTGRAFWSGDAVQGFKYKDPKGEQSAVKAARIKKSPNATFSIKTTITGKLGPVGVTPANPGTNGCVVLKLTGGDTYSVKFSVGDGVVTNQGTTLYKHKKVFAQGSCVFIPSTTSTSGTTSTSTTSTTSTTLYGSPSRAFVDRVRGLLD